MLRQKSCEVSRAAGAEMADGPRALNPRVYTALFFSSSTRASIVAGPVNRAEAAARLRDSFCLFFRESHGRISRGCCTYI